ncbi:MAG: hypothetical protein AAGI28_10690 [Pseudomonadota bacterium]
MKIALISALGLALAATSVPADASGSGSGSRGGFGGFSGNSGVSEAERLQRRGRSQVRKHITCRKCEYHDRLDNNTAAEVARAVRNGRFDIKERDRTAVLFYLRDRYGV